MVHSSKYQGAKNTINAIVAKEASLTQTMGIMQINAKVLYSTRRLFWGPGHNRPRMHFLTPAFCLSNM